MQRALLSSAHKLDYFDPIPFQEGMGTVAGLGDNLQANLHGHPITADLQIVKQPGDGAAVPDVGGITVYHDLHDYPHNPEKRDKCANEFISAKTAEMVSNVLPQKRNKYVSRNLFCKTSEKVSNVLNAKNRESGLRVLVGCASLRRHYPDQVLRVAAFMPLSVETPPAILFKLVY